MDTLALLANSKPAFSGGSERGSLASGLDRLLVRDKIVEWLEVGVGDGKNLTYLLDSVGGSRRLVVTAVDPSPLAVKRVDSPYPVEVVPVGIESFFPGKRYDCINARQSAYYFQDPSNTALTLAGWLSPNGVLAVTLWSRDCVLYRLNGAIARATGQAIGGLCAEDLIRSLSAEEFEIECHREDCGSLDIERLRLDRSAFQAICALAARKISTIALTEHQFAELLAGLEGPNRAERSNEILFVRRRS